MAAKNEDDKNQKELTRLRKRVEELEDQLNDRPARSARRRAASSVQDINSRKTERAARAFRGFALASAEAFRLTADSLSNAASSFLDRNHPDDDDRSVRDLSQRLPGDVFDGMSDAFDDWVEIPAKVADKFSEAFREGEYESRDNASD